MLVHTATATTSTSNDLDFESDTLYVTASDALPDDNMSFDLVILPDLGPILFVDHNSELNAEMVNVFRRTLCDPTNMDTVMIKNDTMLSRQHYPMHPSTLMHGVGGLMRNRLAQMARGIMQAPQAYQQALPRFVTSTNNSHHPYSVRTHTVSPLANVQAIEDPTMNQSGDDAIDNETITSALDRHNKPSFILAYWKRKHQQQNALQAAVSDWIELEPIS
jgi:hypothetical protein